MPHAQLIDFPLGGVFDDDGRYGRNDYHTAVGE